MSEKPLYQYPFTEEFYNTNLSFCATSIPIELSPHTHLDENDDSIVVSTQTTFEEKEIKHFYSKINLTNNKTIRKHGEKKKIIITKVLTKLTSIMMIHIVRSQ